MLEFISFGYFCIPTVNKDLKCDSGKYDSGKYYHGTVRRGKVRRGTFLEPTQLPVNDQLVPFPIRSKKISLEQGDYKRSQSIEVNLLYWLFFRLQKTKI